MAGATLEGHLWSDSYVFFLVFFKRFFLTFFWIPCITPKSIFCSKICTFVVTSGSPLGAFGAPLGDFSWPRCRKGSKKLPKRESTAPRLPKKGPKRRNDPPFSRSLTFFRQFRHFLSYWLLFGSYWRLLAPIGSSWLLLLSICSYCFLLSPIASSFAPIASSCLLLPPRCSSCSLLPPIVSSLLLGSYYAFDLSCCGAPQRGADGYICRRCLCRPPFLLPTSVTHTYMFTRYVSTQIIVCEVLHYACFCETVSIQIDAASTISSIAFH